MHGETIVSGRAGPGAGRGVSRNMRGSLDKPRFGGPVRGLRTWAFCLAGHPEGRAQGPTVDVDNPPGLSAGRSMFGSAIGASGISLFQDTPGSTSAPIGSRPGPSVSRAPVSGLNPQGRNPRREGLPNFKIPALPPANVPAYGELDLPEGSAEIGDAGGLALGDTIDILVRQNLGIIAMRYEIPMAEADVLTASLRANPVF